MKDPEVLDAASWEKNERMRRNQASTRPLFDKKKA